MINIRNKHYEKGLPNEVYIGRGSKLGNPYSHLCGKNEYHCETRDEAIDKYRPYFYDVLLKDPAIQFWTSNIAVFQLENPDQDINLMCYCKPARCHGDVIKEYIEKLMEELKTKKDD